MNYSVINKETGKPLKKDQAQVFSKLLEIHGPKKWTDTVAVRWEKAYRRAQKDFKDLYGFVPEVRWKDDKKDGR